MRVRTSHAPDGWRDEGPCPDVARARNAGVEAAQIPDMLPLIVGTVLSSESNGHHGSATRKCGRFMPMKQEKCAMPVGHKDTHRTWAAVAARNLRFDHRRKAA